MLLAFFFLARTGQAQDFIKGFSLKLMGGYGNMAVGDFNTVMEDLETLFSDIASLIGIEKEGEFKELNRGFECEGEFIMNLAGNFGIGIGAGYIQRKEKSEFSIKGGEPIVNLAYSLEPKFTAIPIKLSVHYFYPISSKVNIFLNGGIGYYFGTITYHTRVDMQWSPQEEEWEKEEIEVKDNALGFHGGLGFEYNVTENIAFFAEGAARHAKLKDWEGDYSSNYMDVLTEQSSGTLWYFEALGPSGLEKYYSGLEIKKEKPTGTNIKNARKAEGDLSGFSFRAGIRVKF